MFVTQQSRLRSFGGKTETRAVTGGAGFPALSQLKKQIGKTRTKATTPTSVNILFIFDAF